MTKLELKKIVSIIIIILNHRCATADNYPQKYYKALRAALFRLWGIRRSLHIDKINKK